MQQATHQDVLLLKPFNGHPTAISISDDVGPQVKSYHNWCWSTSQVLPQLMLVHQSSLTTTGVSQVKSYHNSCWSASLITTHISPQVVPQLMLVHKSYHDSFPRFFISEESESTASTSRRLCVMIIARDKKLRYRNSRNCFLAAISDHIRKGG